MAGARQYIAAGRVDIGRTVAASGESANMGHSEIGAVAQQIGTLFEEGSVVGLSDRQLLERFNAGRDTGGEAAFSALVVRHGPMVLGVCRQLLDDQHLAEDAFQATFLVLARRARQSGTATVCATGSMVLRSVRPGVPGCGSLTDARMRRSAP